MLKPLAPNDAHVNKTEQFGSQFGFGDVHLSDTSRKLLEHKLPTLFLYLCPLPSDKYHISLNNTASIAKNRLDNLHSLKLT